MFEERGAKEDGHCGEEERPAEGPGHGYWVRGRGQVGRAGGVLKNVNGICFVHSVFGALLED